MTHKVGITGHVDHGKTTVLLALKKYAMENGGVTLPSSSWDWREAYRRLTPQAEERRGKRITVRPQSLFIPFEHAGDVKTGAEVIDFPGHGSYTKFVCRSASNPDVIIVVVAADRGVEGGTRRHLTIFRHLPPRNLIVAVNKVDLLEEDEREEFVALVRDEVAEFVDQTRRTVVVLSSPSSSSPSSTLSSSAGSDTDNEGEAFIRAIGVAALPYLRGEMNAEESGIASLFRLLRETVLETTDGVAGTTSATRPYAVISEHFTKPEGTVVVTMAAIPLDRGDRLKVYSPSEARVRHIAIRNIEHYRRPIQHGEPGMALGLLIAGIKGDKPEVSNGDVIFRDKLLVSRDLKVVTYWPVEAEGGRRTGVAAGYSPTLSTGDGLETRATIRAISTLDGRPVDFVRPGDVAVLRLRLEDLLPVYAGQRIVLRERYPVALGRVSGVERIIKL